MFADLQIYDEDLSGFYNKNYFSGDEYVDYMADRRVLQKNFKNRLKVIQKFTDPSRHRTILEIGCAYGFFLDIAKDVFDEVKGIDITEEGTRFARNQLGLDVIKADFLNHDFGMRGFDVVCMWDTIEHLRSPHLFIGKISNLMKSGGILALTTGDIGSLTARIRKEKWRFIKPPEHLHYFSRSTLNKLLDHHGFEILHYGYCGNYLSLGNITYKLLVLNKRAPKIYDLLVKTGFDRFFMYINLFDIMNIVARRR
jgi:2-polyprenyl-3-methyl-5-hydroxy-6-metoxy-1,4-benzoquinol methylase